MSKFESPFPSPFQVLHWGAIIYNQFMTDNTTPTYDVSNVNKPIFAFFFFFAKFLSDKNNDITVNLIFSLNN